MKYNFKNKRKGFTLIELLVVIAIIGLLSSIVLASLNSARDKARAAYIDASMVTYIDAIEAYYVENGHYPYDDAAGTGPYCLGAVPDTSSGCWGSAWEGYDNGYFTDALSEYVPSWVSPNPYDDVSYGSGAIYYLNCSSESSCKTIET